jgi:hypothetical protein
VAAFVLSAPFGTLRKASGGSGGLRNGEHFRLHRCRLLESKSILLKSFWHNFPAKRIGLHVTIGHISCATLASAPPMPPSGFDEVTSLNHLENGLPFTLVFSAMLGKALIQLQRRDIFAHSGI